MPCQKMQDVGFQTPGLKDKIIDVYYELGLIEYSSVRGKMSFFPIFGKKCSRTYSVFLKKKPSGCRNYLMLTLFLALALQQKSFKKCCVRTKRREVSDYSSKHCTAALALARQTKTFLM